MPGFDGSGPIGNGPMTGGARGVCRSNTHRQRVADNDRGNRRGMACRRGFGAQRGGMTRPGYAAGRPDNKWQELEARVTELQQSLARTEQRIDQL
jgi:hypothetical protein